MASEPLFTMVKPEVFKKPTFKAFHALLDNYVRAPPISFTTTISTPVLVSQPASQQPASHLPFLDEFFFF